MPAPTDWITLREATEILAAANIHFTPATIGGWARAGRLQSIKLGGRRFVRRAEVRAPIAAPRRVRAEDLQPVLFEDRGLSPSPMDARALLARILEQPRVVAVRTVLNTYGRAAGGLLANGLAFSALFAAIPTTLLVLGVAGWVGAGDPTIRDQISAALVAALPPLADLIRAQSARSPMEPH